MFHCLWESIYLVSEWGDYLSLSSLVYVSSYIVQGLVLACVLFFLALAKRTNTDSTRLVWKKLSTFKQEADPPRIWLKLFFIPPHHPPSTRRTSVLQAGIPLSYSYYLLLYRASLVICITFLTILVGFSFIYKAPILTLLIISHIVLLLMLLNERWWLKLWVRRRQKQIIYDLFQLSYHLLYFADSHMTIYSKLKRCLPYTTALRRDVELLLMEWTQDADYALKRFKERLACHEAVSFIDTIQALKQHQDDTFYLLLRERIEEYKTHLDLENESKKETSSYVLFVLAGIPILYTFQVFIYPWVKEVQSLLLHLN